MRFEPLAYVLSTLTLWHGVIMIALVSLMHFIGPITNGAPIEWTRIPATVAMLASVCGIFTPSAGQLVGDNYPATTLWPTAFVFGAVFTSIPFWSSDTDAPVGFAIFSIVFGANFFAAAIWLAPQFLDVGIIDFPRLPWGVRL
ncbi:MAG: hypothetical protein AAF559_08655 [Pseudomonadota bacterium]